MNYEGVWVATADENRKLVFGPNGVGYVQVETECFPHFRWRVTPEGAFWQFFRDPEFTQIISKEMLLDCSLTHEVATAVLEFKNAPIPFGFKRFAKHEA